MKKFLLIFALIVSVLFVIDITVLRDKGILNMGEKIQKYDKIENVEGLAVGIEEGNLAPDFTLKDLEGNTVKLSDFKGKTVMLNFWASWCPPCKKEMPYMEKLYKKYKEDGFEIVAVNMANTEKNSGDAEKFIKEHGLTFTIPIDEKGVTGVDYELLAYPTSYFIDSDGVIRSKVIGALDEEYMEKEILKLP